MRQLFCKFFMTVIAIFFPGCSRGELLFAASRPVPELRFVAWRYHLVGQEEYYRDLAQAFEQSRPRIRIVVELKEWAVAHDMIQHWISEGQGPDLTVVPDAWLAEFAPQLDAYVWRLPAA